MILKQKIMELLLKRIAKRKGYTIGKLYKVERVMDEYLAGTSKEYICDTLEPPVVETKSRLTMAQVMSSHLNKVRALKPFAIPPGRYAVVVTQSPKFKAWLPLLLNVPLFEGIRIHAGNTVKDTAGCILVGRNQEVGKVLDSRAWTRRIVKMLTEAWEHDRAHWITIE